MRGTHRIHGHQDSAVAVPREDGGCHFVVEGQALGNDFCGVVVAMFESARVSNRRMSSPSSACRCSAATD
jgi:hypothetical protein